MGNDLPTLTSALTPFPLLPLRDVVVFPHMVIPLFVGRPKSIKALDVAMETGKHILLVAQKSAAKDEPSAEDLYDIGSVEAKSYDFNFIPYLNNSTFYTASYYCSSARYG